MDDESTQYYIGLFGYIGPGALNTEIKNVTLEVDTFDMAANTYYVGSLAGWVIGNATSRVTVSNVAITGTSTINSAGNIIQTVGGLIGHVGEYVTVIDSSSVLNISSGGYNTGGLIGSVANSTQTNIERSFSQGATIAGGSNTGGLIGGIGYAQPNNPAITQSFSKNTVTGTGTATGGFIGSGGSADIADSYATGNVSGQAQVGGFTGNAGWIVNSYSIGSVTGNGSFNGGFNGINGTATNSFWATDAPGTVASSPAGTGKTLTEMQGIDAGGDTTPADGITDFYITAGWVGAVWDLSTGQYPKLQWEP